MKTKLFYNHKNETLYSLKLFVCNKSCCTIMLLLLFLNLNAQTVTTYAGCTINNIIGGNVNGTVTTSQFEQPVETFIDHTTGIMYVSDSYNRRIRKITPSGEVTTLAGSSFGYLDGNGTNAQFKYPYGLAMNAMGILFVADSGTHTIRKISPSGDVTTFAGIADTSGFVDGYQAQFTGPAGLVFDNLGNLIVVDSYNCAIRKITPNGYVSTLAGDGTPGYQDGIGNAAKFRNPRGITIDSSNNLYVTDTDNQLIRKITPEGVVSTIAGNGTPGFVDGTGVNAKFKLPMGIAIRSNGTIYVADTFNHSIREISPSGNVSLLAGGGVPGYTDSVGMYSYFRYPYGVSLDQSENNLFVADYDNNRIRKITLENLATNPFSKGEFSVYPNPVKDILTIQNPENLSFDKIIIIDLTGKKVLEQKPISNRINVEKLQSGMYLLQITSEGKNSATKFIKN